MTVQHWAGPGSAMVIKGGIDCYQFITISTQLVIILALEKYGMLSRNL